MSYRVNYSTKVDKDLKERLRKLSILTGLPQSKLIDEAITDLLKKYEGGVIVKWKDTPENKEV